MSLDVSITVVKKSGVFDYNITHNLGEMAEKAGIYTHLWRPEKLHIKKAKELIEPLSDALEDLKARPDYYRQFDAPNSWGKYENFVEFVEKYLAACKEYPNGRIYASR